MPEKKTCRFCNNAATLNQRTGMEEPSLVVSGRGSLDPSQHAPGRVGDRVVHRLTGGGVIQPARGLYRFRHFIDFPRLVLSTFVRIRISITRSRFASVTKSSINSSSRGTREKEKIHYIHSAQGQNENQHHRGGISVRTRKKHEFS